MSYQFLPARWACKECKREREFVRFGEHDGIPAYRWEDCPEHPGSDSYRLCTYCGSDSRRCSVNRCQKDAEVDAQHGYFRSGDGIYSYAFCASHSEHPPEEGTDLAKHVVGPYDPSTVTR